MSSPRMFLAITALVLAAPAASAQSAAQRPTAEEHRWVLACVEAGRGPCPYRITARCYADGYRGAVPAPVARVRGRIAGHPRNCAPIETAIWAALAQRWLAEAIAAVPPGQADILRRAERRFLAYRDAECGADSLLYGGALGSDMGADCRLELTALRALRLRRISEDMRAQAPQ